MDKLDRFQALHRLFISHRKPVPIAVLAERMECTEKTVKRAIEEKWIYRCYPGHGIHQRRQCSCCPNDCCVHCDDVGSGWLCNPCCSKAGDAPPVDDQYDEELGF